MPDCDDCGDPLEGPRDKNASGWWRDYCLPCIGKRAYSPDERTTVQEILDDDEVR